MKNLFTLIFIAISLQSFAQEIDYFANNPEWRQTSTCAVPYPCVQTDQYVYYVNGDSTINDTVYTKIFIRGIYDQNWFDSPPAIECGASGEYNNYYLLLLQDGLQMYIRTLETESLILLYDFDLSVGDALPMTYNNYTSDILIDSIDSILVGDDYRKRFHFQGLWASVIIEGIGSDLGLFEPMGSIFECGHSLNCFALDETVYYPELNADCELNVKVDEIEKKIGVSYYPNPVKEKIKITFSNDLHSLKAMIYTLDGKACKVDLIKNSPSSYSIDMNQLNAGFYLLSLNINGEQISEIKLLKE